MSLVSDALKKAEREAAAREARAKGLPVPLETPSQPYRARRGQRRGGAWLGVVAGVGVALAVAFVLSRTSAEEKAAAKGSTETTSTAAGRPAAAPAASQPVEAPLSATGNPETAAPQPKIAAGAEPSRPTPSASEPRAQQPSPSLPKTASNEGTSRPSVSEPETPSETPRPAPAAPAPRGSKEYVRRVDFPDGSKLELGGIAYSETAPFAYLNGRLLKTGEAIAGYTLVAIERDRVVVRGAAGELTLRLKPR